MCALLFFFFDTHVTILVGVVLVFFCDKMLDHSFENSKMLSKSGVQGVCVGVVFFMSH